MKAPIDFHFDFSSPYSYVANEWLPALAARHGRPLRRHAILLGATFQVTQLKSPVSYPVKREYSLHDFARSARFEGLPFKLPEVFPVATQNAARVFWWLAETRGQDAAAAWATAGLRAMFTRNVPLHDAAALRALAAEHGLDADEAEAVWNDPQWKARLKRANDDAIAAGVFGAPYVVVDGEPFWGNDRKPQIERWLASGPLLMAAPMPAAALDTAAASSAPAAEAAVEAAALLRIQAHANALANHRLHGAMAVLSQDEMTARRIGFFPSLLATLNHILAVDAYYIAALEGDAAADAVWHRFAPAQTLADLAARQRDSDARLVRWCSALTQHSSAASIAMPRGEGRIQRDAAAHVLQHLFMHQTHHRGQVHCMLSGTRAEPPQLDEFLMPSEAALRGAEMAALGWNEAAVYGPR